MKKLTSILICILVQISIFAQEQTVFESKIYSEQIIINKDTLIIIDYLKTVNSEFYESKIQASFLLRKTADRIDTLLYESPKEPNFEVQNEFCQPKVFDIEEELYKLRFGQKSYDVDSVKNQFSSTVRIEHIDKGIFQIFFEESEYTGGAHGYGTELHKHYDYLSKKEFDFDDIFKPEAKKVIYSIFLKEFGITENESDFDAFPVDFVLSNETIEFYCGMYGTLFGVGGNYLGRSLQIPLSDLQKHMIKNSPIERLIK